MSEWVNKIKQGDFSGAEQALAETASRQVREAQVLNEMQKLAAETENGKYVAIPAAIKTKEAYERGEFQSGEQAVAHFRRQLEIESDEFVKNVQPGYRRSAYDPHIPATQEIQDYIRTRQGEQQALKDEGKRIAGIHSNSPNSR